MTNTTHQILAQQHAVACGGRSLRRFNLKGVYTIVSTWRSRHASAMLCSPTCVCDMTHVCVHLYHRHDAYAAPPRKCHVDVHVLFYLDHEKTLNALDFFAKEARLLSTCMCICPPSTPQCICRGFPPKLTCLLKRVYCHICVFLYRAESVHVYCAGW